MTLLIFFAIVFATIILAIVLQRIIHCPILVGFAFFAIFLVIAAVFDSTTLIIIAVILGILAFLAAFFDCVFTRSRFFRNNPCLSCNSCNNNNNCNNSNCNNNDTLTIINGNGEIVARINGNSITCNDEDNGNNCGCGCGNNSILTDGNILTTNSDNNGTIGNSNCGCNSRYYRSRRY